MAPHPQVEDGPLRGHPCSRLPPPPRGGGVGPRPLLAIARPFLALLVFVVGACGGSEDPQALPPWIEVGAGHTAWVGLAEGDPVELVHGPQGGWHLDVAARFGGVAPDLILTYRVRDEARATQVGYPVKRPLGPQDVTALDGGGWQHLGDRVVLAIAGPADVVGRSLIAEVEAVVASTILRDARPVTIVDKTP